MTPTNGNGTAKAMIRHQAKRVRDIVENSDYSECPVHGQKEVSLFLVNGITAILEEQGKVRGITLMSGTLGGGVGAVIGGVVFWTGKYHGWW